MLVARSVAFCRDLGPPRIDAALQGYLAHKKPFPPRTILQAYAQGPIVFVGWGAVFHEWGNPVQSAFLLATSSLDLAPYRGTSLIRNLPHPRTLQ